MKKVLCADIMFLITLLIQFPASFIVALLNSAMAAGGSGLSTGLTLLLSQIILALPVIILLIYHKAKNPQDSIMEYMRIKKIKIGTIFLVIVFSFLIRPLIQIVNAFSLLFVENEIQNSLSPMIENQSLLASLIIVGLVPGMFEEFVYRGYFFGTYKRHGFWRGVIFSSLIFGMMHLNFNQFGYAMVMGLIMCLLAEATGSIIGGMIVHLSINGSSVLLIWLLPRITEYSKRFLTPEQMEELGLNTMDTAITRVQVIETIAVMIIPAVICTVLAGLLLYAIASVEKRKREFLSCFGKEGLLDRQKSNSNRPRAPYEQGMQSRTMYNNQPMQGSPVPSYNNGGSHFVEENMIKSDIGRRQEHEAEKYENQRFSYPACAGRHASHATKFENSGDSQSPIGAGRYASHIAKAEYPGPIFYIAAIICLIIMVLSAIG